MTFLNPIFLWLLPLIAVPVIIHLLAKRKSKIIEFPSLKFLKLLEQDALKKFNLKQLLLLIIRTLMVLLLILAFARPTLDQSEGFSLQAGSTDLFLIAVDNTASNHAMLEKMKTAWIKDLATELSEKGYRVVYAGVATFELTERLDLIVPGYGDVFDGELQTVLAEQVNLDTYERQSILWIGDGQDARLTMDALVGWNKYLFLMPLEYDAGLSHLSLPTTGMRQGDTYEITAIIQRSPDYSEALSLELLVNEKRQNQLVLENDQLIHPIIARVEAGGYQSGRLELSSDPASYNDVRYYILPAADNIPVQVLRSTLLPDFWRIMKSSADDQGLNLDIDLLFYDQMDNLDLSTGGTVIIDDASRLEAYNWSRLTSFVEKGGQVIIFGNGGLDMSRLMNIDLELTPEDSEFSLGLYTTEDLSKSFPTGPLKAIISEDRLKVSKRYQTNGAEFQETWVRYLDGEPFLGLQYVQAGRVVWFNTDFGISANNLPLLGMFPPLMIELIQSQSLQTQSDLYNIEVGDTLHFHPQAQVNDGSPFSIQRPDGTTDYLSPDEEYRLHYSNTDLPGIYKLLRGRMVLELRAVNVSTHEAEAHGTQYLFADSDVFMDMEPGSLKEEIGNQGLSLAIWPYLLLLLFLLWIAETYLSRIKTNWRQNV